MPYSTQEKKRIHDREYRKRPEVKARDKARRSTPEYLKRFRELAAKRREIKKKIH